MKKYTASNMIKDSRFKEFYLTLNQVNLVISSLLKYPKGKKISRTKSI